MALSKETLETITFLATLDRNDLPNVLDGFDGDDLDVILQGSYELLSRLENDHIMHEIDEGRDPFAKANQILASIRSR